MLDFAGKSALVEALMGFQFNHVGGGTKTRRPVTLHMKYNQSCTEPRCYLITEDRPPREEENSLEELQVGFKMAAVFVAACLTSTHTSARISMNICLIFM